MDFDDASEKTQKIKRLISKGEYDEGVSRYIPGTLNLMFQGMLENVTTEEPSAHISYRDVENLKFQTLLIQNCYTNPNSFQICFPIKIKKATNVKNDIDDDMIMVNKFFAHWIKEINITNCGSNKPLIPTCSPGEVYQHSDMI